jgi:hypothetical protein
MTTFVPIETFFEVSDASVFVGDIALILAAAGGFVAPRWRDGLILSTLLVIVAYALLLGLPTVGVGKRFPWKALNYTLFWLPVVLLYARLLLAFTLTFSLRNLFDVARRAWRRRSSRE